MEPAQTDWAATLERLLEGDRAAFLVFNRLVTGCLRQLRAYDFEQEWDDLRQEVLAAVVANARAGKLRDPQAFVGYVRIVTRNKFMDRLKRRLRHQEKETLPWEDACAAAATDTEPLPAPVRHDLREALDTLPADDRDLVEGVYVAGHTYQEMADRSGIPLGTLKRKLRTGLEKLRRRLDGDPGPDPETAAAETFET